MKTKFEKELEALINSHSMENGSNTPDFILANYLLGCLKNFNKTTKARDKWYGKVDDEKSVGLGDTLSDKLPTLTEEEYLLLNHAPNENLMEGKANYLEYVNYMNRTI